MSISMVVLVRESREKRLPFYYISPVAVDVVVPDHTSEDLATSNPSAKVLPRLKLLRSERPLPLVPPQAMLPSVLDSRGKGIMADSAAALSAGVSRPRPSFGPASSFRDIFGDAIHWDLFLFSPGPYYATYPEGSVAGNWEMVWIKALSSNQLTANMSVLHCLMMPHGGELLDRYRGLLQSHHEHVAGLNDKLSSSNDAFTKSKAKGKDKKKKIKFLTKSIDQLNAEIEYSFLNIITKHAMDPVSIILQLEPEKLAHPMSVPTLRDTRVSPLLIKESTVTPVCSSLEFLSYTIPYSFVAFLEPNKGWVNAMVDGSDHEITGDAGNGNSGSVFNVVYDDVKFALVGLKRVSFGPNDVVVALYAGDKGDGFLPSFVADEEAPATPSGA
nr:hypothetical protein [Tanacetum cinerariifolium]